MMDGRYLPLIALGGGIMGGRLGRGLQGFAQATMQGQQMQRQGEMDDLQKQRLQAELGQAEAAQQAQQAQARAVQQAVAAGNLSPEKAAAALAFPEQYGKSLFEGGSSGAQSALGKLKADLNSGLIDQATYEAGVKEATSIRPAFGNIQLTPPSVTINSTTKDQISEVQKYFGETFNKIMESDLNAPAKLAKIEQLDRLLNGIETGTFTPQSIQFKAGLKGLGIDPEALGLTDNVGQAEAAQALSGELTLQMRNPSGGAGMPGAMSDADRQFLQSMVPGLSTTAEGRKMMLDLQKRMIQRDKDVARKAREYTAKSGALDQGFFDELATWANENPIAPKQYSPQDAANLPSGTVFMTEDGRVMVKQ